MCPGAHSVRSIRPRISDSRTTLQLDRLTKAGLVALIRVVSNLGDWNDQPGGRPAEPHPPSYPDDTSAHGPSSRGIYVHVQGAEPVPAELHARSIELVE